MCPPEIKSPVFPFINIASLSIHSKSFKYLIVDKPWKYGTEQMFHRNLNII